MVARPQIIRANNRGGMYSKGKHAVGICHRSGFKYLLNELKFEPGTNHFVHRSENDWDNSLVSHPQNYPPEKKEDRIALRWSFPDDALSVGTIVSADALFLPVYASVCNHWIEMPSTPTYPSIGVGVSGVVSIGTGVSDYSLDFSQSKNSMYLIVLFPGI
jgi:hypothetical protein